MEEARTGTATYRGSVTNKWGLIDVVSDVNGYTDVDFETGSHPAGYDTDKDGMPDEWEIANGLNPKSAADALAKSLDPKKWYTNLEVYCNSLVQDIMIGGNKGAESSFDEYYPRYVKADGTVVEAIEGNVDGITGVTSGKSVIATLYYNMHGARINNPENGIYIKVEQYADGSRKVTKCISHR